jgi:hypothetical protein
MLSRQRHVYMYIARVSVEAAFQHYLQKQHPGELDAFVLPIHNYWTQHTPLVRRSHPSRRQCDICTHVGLLFTPEKRADRGNLIGSQEISLPE